MYIIDNIRSEIRSNLYCFSCSNVVVVVVICNGYSYHERIHPKSDKLK